MTDLKYDDKGLIPVVVQDSTTGEVLMVAWSNAEAVELMKSTGYTHFWSRSRQKMWKKGEESGHVQKIVSMQVDCDADTLLVRVVQAGGIACHTGKPSCFDEVIYGDVESTSQIIPDLKRVVHDRKENPIEGSYTCKLFNDENKMCKKVVEEAAEFVLTVKDKNPNEGTTELADLIYHTMVAIEKSGVPMDKVFKELTERSQ
jgi:phosphoribosyl-ATP pyrophosphohydrolase/phosphoribosyl-AMP cyclohydrolase